MRYYRGFLAGLAVVCMSASLLAGCSASPVETTTAAATPAATTPEPTVQDDSGNCDEVQVELQAVQAKYDKLISDFNELNTNYSQTTAKYDDLSAKYGSLQQKYDDLNVKYNAIQGMADIETGDIEKAIFAAINGDRTNNGVGELEWAEGLYWYAKQHSDHLAEQKKLELSDFSYNQAVASAAGYATAEQLTNGTMLIWKEATSYATNFLNPSAKYGVVAVSKTGDVYYITYFSNVEG